MSSASECPCTRSRRISIFVLDRLMNKIRPGSIARIDTREDGMFHTSNVIKFLEPCFSRGFPPEDLFLRDDLIHATPDSLARVTNTIIALVKWPKMTALTHVPRMRGGATFKPLPPPPPRRSETVVDPRDSVPQGMQSIGRPTHESNTNLTRNRSRVRSSTKSSTIKNQSSMRNQSTIYGGTKQSSTSKSVSVDPTDSSLRDASVRNESISADRRETNPYVPRVERPANSPVVSGGRAHTRNRGESRLMLVMKEGKGWNKFVRFTFIFMAFVLWAGWLIVVYSASR